MRKQTIRCIIVFLILIITTNSGLVVFAAQPDTIEPMYTGLMRVKPDISISSSGTITCTDTVTLKGGYSADVVWELQSSTSYAFTGTSTWTNSGTSVLSLNATRQAIRGYNYRLKTSIKVYNSNSQLVDNEVVYSKIVSY